MTDTSLSDDLSNWQRSLSSDLTEILNRVKVDAQVYGFTLELPSDFSNDGIIARFAKCPDGVDSKTHVMKSRDLEDDWEYDPNGFGDSCDGLQSLYVKYKTELKDEDFYSKFGDLLYGRCLVLQRNSVISSLIF